ncbi:hypothetical protein BDZ94DRAFT_1310738 [Collybia nuda]|uniref:RPA43 OB domain-containing protein n=1 Tax=Collybia nuda TaxID=64659 RepID=A0A9P5Y2V6_9AGAR|nr:hypothetical protein BDZ94DRAFT_1310738 [Collybia nuda]
MISQHTSKKRKQPNLDIHVEAPVRKSRKMEKPAKDKRDKKGKARDTEFHVVRASLMLSIPPMFASNPRVGVEEMLDSMIMRYIPALRGVVLSHSNLLFLTKSAAIQADCPFLVCNVGFDATLWSPHVGMKLVGRVNLCSPDHVSLLLHRTFNISIPRHHIPQQQWKFEYGPAENDPEYGPAAHDETIEGDQAPENKEGDGGGKWVHHLTNEKLGGSNGFLEFTVIGLTVANEMLSLLGSIQEDPFSPEHAPKPGPSAKCTPSVSDIENVEDEPRADPSEEGEEEIESDEDTFKALGKMTDKVAAQAKREADEAAQNKETTREKKRKRKTGQIEINRTEKNRKKKT